MYSGLLCTYLIEDVAKHNYNHNNYYSLEVLLF